MASKKNPTSVPRIVADLESKVASFDKQLSGIPGGLRDDMKSLKEGVDAVRLEQAESRGQKRLLQILVGVAVAALVGQYFNRNPNSQAITDLGIQITELSVLSKDQAERVLRLEGYHFRAELEEPLPEGDPEALGVVMDQTLQAAVEAQERRVTVAPSIVAQRVRSILAVRERSPEVADTAWRAASALAAYNSTLPKETPFIDPGLIEIPIDGGGYNGWGFQITGGGQGNLVGFGRFVPASRAARLEDIGSGRNKDNERGPPFVRLEGTSFALNLDGKWLKNIELRNVIIRYSGGPLIMENVVFTNCKFEIEQSDPAKEFLLATLSEAPVDFRTS